MAFSLEVTGVEELLRKMEQMGEKGEAAASVALYEGARVTADALSAAVQGIEAKRVKYPAPPGKKRMPSTEEKAVLEGAKHGVAKFRKGITKVDTSVGYQNSGYGQINGKTVPVPLIANAINSGTSFMKKQPFIRKAISQSKGAAQAAIENKLREELDKLSAD